MKTIKLIVVIFTLFALPISGTAHQQQGENHAVIHPLVEFSKKYNIAEQGSVQSMLKSNDSSTLEYVEHQGWDGSKFVSYYTVDFIYQGGKRVESRYYTKQNSGGDWEIEARDVYEFQNNRLISETNQIVVNSGYVNDYRTLFTYQMAGNDEYLLETIDQFWNSDTSLWENEERIEFMVSNGKLSAGESSIWVGTEWTLYERFLLEEIDNDLYLTYQDFTGTEWLNADRQIYENFSIIEMYLLFIEEMNMIDTGAYLAFAELFPDYTEQVWDGIGWSDFSRQVTVNEYLFGTGEIIAKKISGELFDIEWKVFSEVRISYENSKPDELVLYTAEEAETAELMPVFAEEFEYSEDGLLRYVFQKYSVGDNSKALSNNELIIMGRLILEWSGATTSIGGDTKPFTFSLGNAYPNPFNPSTVIPFQVQTAGDISIRVFDMLGRNVASLADGIFPEGNHTVRFNADGLSSGVYMVRLDAPGYQQTRRVTLLK